MDHLSKVIHLGIIMWFCFFEGIIFNLQVVALLLIRVLGIQFCQAYSGAAGASGILIT
jgi:hypothetical protein